VSDIGIIAIPDATAGTRVTASIQLQDQYGNLVATAAETTVTVTVTGSLSGSALFRPFVNPANVQLRNGRGTLDIQSFAVEEIELSLSDTAETGFVLQERETFTFLPGPKLPHAPTSSPKPNRPSCRPLSHPDTLTALQARQLALLLQSRPQGSQRGRQSLALLTKVSMFTF
jgi:hypothetical protein